MMGTYCTSCRVAGPDIFDPPEHLPTCRYYPVEAKSRDKTILQLAEQIGKLSASLEIALNYQKSDNEKLEQLSEQIGVLSASLELALNQQKIDQAENQRLKGLLMDIADDIQDELCIYGYIEKIQQELEAAQPQKESE